MRPVPALTTIAVALAITGSALAAPTRTQAAWGPSADRICAQIDKEIDKIAEPENLRGFAVQLPKLLAAGKKEHRLLKALARPVAQKTTIEAYLATYPRLFAILEQMTTVAKANDETTFQALLAKGEPISDRAKKLASQLKAPACAD